MISGGVRSQLPVPEFINEDLRHSRKQARKLDEKFRVKKPPKLNKYHDSGFNRSGNSSMVHVVSFKDSSGSGDELLSSVYNKDISGSYFEQCFDMLSKLGEGSFGEVFKVRSKEDGLLYAVKKSKQFFRSEVYRQERLEEVRRYEQFSHHDHCVTLYNAWEQEDRLYMQMELCEGSLENYLAQKCHIPEEKIWSILLDLLLALKSLHDRNLIHLDIKLENILVGDDGTCKLGDFGLVVDVDRANLLQANEGDSRYIAPELLQGNFSKAADVFCLGIAILELSCNLELPPNGPLWQQLRSGILPEEFIKHLSPELQFIIKSMMASDPLKRPTVNELLLHGKLVAIQQRRKRWEIFNPIKQYYRKTRRQFWAKMCNFKSILLAFFLQILIILKLKEPVFSQNDSYTEQFLNSSSAQNSPLHILPRNSIRIINSTPLTPHTPSFRSRKDLSRICFRNDLTYGSEDCSLEQDLSSSNSSVENYETSSLICKKLFFKARDSD